MWTPGSIDLTSNPDEYLSAARRHELTAAWSVVAAAAVLAILPGDDFLRSLQALVVAPCLIAGVLLVNHRQRAAALVTGAAIVFLIWVIIGDLIYEFTADTTEPAAALFIRLNAAGALLVYGFSRIKRSEQSRRLAWGARRIEQRELQRAWHEAMMNEE